MKPPSLSKSFVLSLALSWSFGANAQSLSFTRLESSAEPPSARFDGTIAYDSTERRLYLFGGGDPAPRNDLWVYSFGTRRWQEIVTVGLRPPARFGHTLVWDPARSRIVVFGGQASGFFSDVWAFDTSRGTWQQLAGDESGPSRRYGHSAILEPGRDRMIVSHGFTNSGRFDDTWAFEFTTNTWRNLNPPGVRPLRRCLHHAVYDAPNGQMLLYGGCASGFGPCPLGDLWSFDLSLNRWTERTAAVKPPAREHYGMTFDAGKAGLILFGGNGTARLNDTWLYDTRAGSWQQPAVQGPSPTPRSRHESAFASDRGVSYFFGGQTSTGYSNELWMFGPSFASQGPEFSGQGLVNTFSGIGGAVAPGEIVTIYGSGLGPIEGIAFGFDRESGRLPVNGPGLAVSFDGIPAPLYFARQDQLNVQVPYEVSGLAEVRVVVTVNGRSSIPVTLPVVPTHPGLFPGVWNQDGLVNSESNPATRGSIIVLYATGQGVTFPASLTGVAARAPYPEPAETTSVEIDGQPAEILFRAQAPQTVGVMQLNVRLPEETAPGTGRSILLRIGSRQSQGKVAVGPR